MICTEDDNYYEPGYVWELYNCKVKLLDVLYNDTYTMVCDITVGEQTYYEEMLLHNEIYTYGSYTVTCDGFIGAGDEIGRAKVIICADEEANQILTLYLRPYPWSDNNKASSILANKSKEIDSIFAGAFSGISGHKYISHEIVIEKPDFSQIDLVGIQIYVYSTVDPVSPQFAPIAVALLLFIVAIFAGSLEYVGNVWQDILLTYKVKYPITVRESGITYSELIETLIENGCYEVNNGEMSPEEFIVLLRDICTRNHAHRNMISPKNSLVADDSFEMRIENAIDKYNTDGNFDSLCATAKDAAQTRTGEDKTETGNNYDPGDMPDLSSTTDEIMKYLMYGGIVFGGIMLGTLGIQFVETIKR